MPPYLPGLRLDQLDSHAERINKNNDFKQEQKAERLLESLGKQNKKSLIEMYKEVGYKLIDEYNDMELRLVSPITMIKIMEINCNFLLRCAENSRTILFTAEVMYSGLYDDIWIETIKSNDDGNSNKCLNEFQNKLISIADKNPLELFPYLHDKCIGNRYDEDNLNIKITIETDNN